VKNTQFADNITYQEQLDRIDQLLCLPSPSPV